MRYPPKRVLRSETVCRWRSTFCKMCFRAADVVLECLVCNHPTSQSVGKDKTDMRKVSTRFISVPRRHRSNTSTWYFCTVSCLFLCPSHLVRTHSTHRVFPLGVCHSAELFPDLAPPHFCEGYINNWTCSINSGTCSFSTRFFSSSAVVVQFLFLELFDASQKAFLFHIVFQVPFLGNTLHLKPWREPLEFSNRVVDPPLGVPIGNIRDPTSGPPDTSLLHACQIQDYPIPLVSTAACGVPLWTESSVPSCGSRLLECSAVGPCPQVGSCSFLRDTREAIPVHLLLIKTGLWSRPSIPSPALSDGVVPLPAVPSIEGIRPSWDCRHPIVT